MKHPNIQFNLNINLDIEVATHFLDICAGGVDFGEGIIKLHPGLSKAKKVSGKTRKPIVSGYIQKYYFKNKNELEKILVEIKKEWLGSQKYFYKAVAELFHNYPWPEGKYICYLSIFNCNPRFLDDKTFQVYYKHDEKTNHVIAHELLHFIFYDYFEKMESEFFISLSENNIWKFSEVFNDLVLGQPNFTRFKATNEFHYPEIEILLNKFKKTLGNKFSLNDFFNDAKTIS